MYNKNNSMVNSEPIQLFQNEDNVITHVLHGFVYFEILLVGRF